MIVRSRWPQISGPRQMLRQAAEGRGLAMASAEDYLLLQALSLREAGGPAPWDADEPIAAYVNHGRWVVACVCRTGLAASREWGLACCPHCGARWRAAFPADADEIERALLARPLRETQNWSPGETLADIERENAVHGVS